MKTYAVFDTSFRKALSKLAYSKSEHGRNPKVLSLFDWNRSAAAKALGIDRRTLFSKIQRYGLVGPMRPRGGADGEQAYDDEE